MTGILGYVCRAAKMGSGEAGVIESVLKTVVLAIVIVASV